MRPPGPLEIILIITILVIVFGVGRLPQVSEFIGKGVGKGVSLLRGDKAKDSQDEEAQPVAKKKKVIKKLD